MEELRELKDNEIRILGQDAGEPIVFPPNSSQKSEAPIEVVPLKSRRVSVALWCSLAALVLSAIGVLVFVLTRTSSPDPIPQPLKVQKCTVSVDTTTTATTVVETKIKPTVSVQTDSVNDIGLTIITPQGCEASLTVGPIDTLDQSIILCAQTADIRSDNKEIVSAFVLHGEPIARGVAKRGFCAIIRNTITLGMADVTPMFERVVEEKGDFFRQYPLVHDSKMVENKPKGKSVRKALCMKDDKICIIFTNDRESYNDFATALQDYGVTEAISLVGSNATLFLRDEEGTMHSYGCLESHEPNVNYIVFRK